MRYVQGIDRNQTTMLPEVLDDFVAENNPVRFIDAFVDKLDLLKHGFKYAETKETGRKPYNPADLIKLYIYGYLYKVRSSRQLEKASYQNLEVLWLIHKLHPDFKTIADFRKDNGEALKLVYRDFTLLCKDLDLYGCELIAIDGSKFSASNSNARNYTKVKLSKLIAKVDKEIDHFLKAMEKGDEIEKNIQEQTSGDLTEKIKKLFSRKEKYQMLQTQIEKSQEKQISLTDPDSRLMTTKKGQDVSYNIQIVVDNKHKLIVTHEVTNDGNDQNQLSNMAIKAKEILGVDRMTAIADAGYWERNNLKKCYEENIECYVPKPQKSNNKKLGLFTKDDFQYDPNNDCYYCPAGKKLIYDGKTQKKKEHIEKIYSTRECYGCKLKAKCTRSKWKRYLYRWVHEEIVESIENRCREDKKMMELRKSLAEHPFGSIKHWMGYNYFLLKRIPKVSTETALIILTYNLKRVLNIVDFKTLMNAV